MISFVGNIRLQFLSLFVTSFLISLCHFLLVLEAAKHRRISLLFSESSHEASLLQGKWKQSLTMPLTFVLDNGSHAIALTTWN